MYDGFGQDELDGTPCSDWCIGVPIAAPFDSVRAIDVQASLPLVDFVCLDLALAFHLPDCWKCCGAFGDLGH